jgi:hypothetical protein
VQRDHTSVRLDPLAGFSKSKSTRRLIFGFCSVAKLRRHARVCQRCNAASASTRFRARVCTDTGISSNPAALTIFFDAATISGKP